MLLLSLLSAAHAAPIVYGYIPYWEADNVSQIDFDRLTDIAVFDLEVNSDGSATPSSEAFDGLAREVVAAAHPAGVSVHLCVTTFDPDVMRAVLTSSTRTAALVQDLSDAVATYGADGVNIDFEGLEADLSDEFAAFVEDVAAEVPEVVVATPAIDWDGSYDYSRLAAATKGLFIMGYNYHYSGGDPGPVAPLYGQDPWGAYALDWSVEDYLSYDAPPEKLILGLPLYGIRWPTTSSAVPGSASARGSSIFLRDALDLAAAHGRQWDDATQTPYVVYQEGSQWYQAWYDDADSVRIKSEWALDQDLAGVGFWALSYQGDDADFWDAIGSLGGDTGGDTGTPVDPNNRPPVADAGRDQSVEVGEEVVLDGRRSVDPEGASLTYTWVQIEGPTVTLSPDAATGRMRFLMPEDELPLRFTLVVNDGALDSVPDEVLVRPPRLVEGKSGGGCAAVPMGGLPRAGAVGVVFLAGIAAQRRRKC